MSLSSGYAQLMSKVFNLSSVRYTNTNMSFKHFTTIPFLRTVSKNIKSGVKRKFQDQIRVYIVVLISSLFFI